MIVVTGLDWLPADCWEEEVGFDPSDVSAGRLVFNDYASYEVPNYSVRFTDQAASELALPNLKGDDVEAVNRTISYAQYERTRVARVPMEMLWITAPDGTPFSDVHVGMELNLEYWYDIAELSRTAEGGLQSLTWYRWDGHGGVTFDARVSAPVIGDVKRGLGCKLTVTITVPNPVDQLGGGS